MRALLDTHAMYWYADGDPQLSAVAQTLIQDASNEILISPASYWELAIKVSLGKLKLNRPYDEFFAQVLDLYRFQVLPILIAHTAKLINLAFPPNHKDPFDRLLVAQALVEGIPIVSVDPQLDQYGVTRIW